MRAAKSFTLEPDVNEYIASTKGEASASQRVNELIRTAMVKEKYEALEAEAATFFASVSEEDREEAAVFRSASIRTITRDE